MLTLAEAKKQRRELMGRIEVADLEKTAETLRLLREQLAGERARRNAALTQTKCDCRAVRLTLREKALVRRKAALENLRDTYAQERADARAVCLVNKAEVHATARDPIERAKKKLDAERKYRHDLRRIERGNRAQRRSVHRAHASERRSESDDAVLANVPPEYQALWKRVKDSIQGNSRASRSEVFMAYAEQHPDEVWSAMGDDSDHVIRELEEQQARAERALRPLRPPTSSKRRRSPAPADDLRDAVPF